MAKAKRKAVYSLLTGKVDHYTNTKTEGVRSLITGKIVKRVKKKKGPFDF